MSAGEYSGGNDTCLEVRVQARSEDALQIALDLVVRNNRAVEGWAERDGWLVFYWAMPQSMSVKPLSRLPFKTATNSKFVKEFIVQWLTSAEYPPEPDHDGSNGMGFEITNVWQPGWNHYEAFQVRPAWMEYHK